MSQSITERITVIFFGREFFTLKIENDAPKRKIRAEKARKCMDFLNKSPCIFSAQLRQKESQPDWVGFLFVCEADFELPERPPEEVVGEQGKKARRALFPPRYGTKQGAAGGGRRPTHRDYAAAEGNKKSHPQGFLDFYHPEKQMQMGKIGLGGRI